MASYVKETPIVASYLPPHVRLRLHQEGAATTIYPCQPVRLATKQRYVSLQESSKHKDYGGQHSPPGMAWPHKS